MKYFGNGRLAFVVSLAFCVASISADTRVQGAWKRLCNGKNLDGWEVVGAGDWSVKGGEIVMRRLPNDSAGGWLVTRQDYGDFILRLKFKAGQAQFNSGILIRDPGHAKTARPALNGFEVKLAQGDRVENGNGTIWYVASAFLRQLPWADWTDIEIRCVGDHITTFINGQKMAETHTRRSYKGAIGLHLHGGRDTPNVHWKDIEIRELPETAHGYQLMEEKLVQAPGENHPLLNPGATLGGLRSGTAQHSVWNFDSGVLKGSGGRDSVVLTRDRYSDFVLSFDFRVSSRGDAGVLFRVPDSTSSTEHAGGYEFHVVDGDAVNPAASIVDIARAFMLDSNLERIYRPGNWNHASVYARGDHLVTYMNLQKELDVHDGRSRDGFIGFRTGVGAAVEFRNVLIKPISGRTKPLESTTTTAATTR